MSATATSAQEYLLDHESPTSMEHPYNKMFHLQELEKLLHALGKTYETNHQIIQLAQIVVDTVPGCSLEVRGEAGADQRTYQADFSKFARTFPDFQFKWTPAKGAKELYQAYTDVGLTHEDFLDRRFTRLKWLNYLLESNRLDGALRWQTSKVTPA